MSEAYYRVQKTASEPRATDKGYLQGFEVFSIDDNGDQKWAGTWNSQCTINVNSKIFKAPGPFEAVNKYLRWESGFDEN